MLLVFLEERGSGVVSHPSFDNSKDSDRITPHLGTWKGHSTTKRSGVYDATIAEADTVAILEINKDGQLVQDIRSTSDSSNVTTSVKWTGSISSNLITFDGGFQITLLPAACIWDALPMWQRVCKNPSPSIWSSAGLSHLARDKDWFGHMMWTWRSHRHILSKLDNEFHLMKIWRALTFCSNSTTTYLLFPAII